jgi:hypothetical protein
VKTLPPLEFTLDGPGLTLEQIGAALKYQQQLKARQRAAAPPDREPPAQLHGDATAMRRAKP